MRLHRYLCAVIAACAASATMAALQDPRAIEQAARATIAKRLDPTPGRHRYDTIALDRRLRLTRCPVTLEATPAGQIRGSVASVQVRCPAARGWTLYVQVRVHTYLAVLVTTDTVAAGDRIGRENLRAETRDVAALGNSGGYFTDAAALTDKVAARTLTPGTVVSPALLRKETLIRRNETVRVIALAGTARIESQGIALQPGARDDLVRVRNNASGRIVQGRVTAAGEVQVGN